MGDRKYFFLISTFILFLTAPALAKPLRHKVAVLPAQHNAKVLCVEYEGRTDVTTSIIWRAMGWLPESSEASVFGLGMGSRYYPHRDALRGFYITPSIETIWSSTQSSKTTTIRGEFSADLSLGYQIIIGNMISLDLSAGLAIPYYNLIGDDKGVAHEFSYSLVPIYKLGVGFVW